MVPTGPPGLEDNQAFIEAIEKIGIIQQELEEDGHRIAADLQLEPPDTGFTWIFNRLPIPGLKNALLERTDPVSALTYSVRNRMINLAEQIQVVTEQGKQGVERYNFLNNVITQIEAGDLSPNTARVIITQATVAHVPGAIRLIEQQVNDMLNQLPEPAKKNLEEQDLQSLREVRDLSEPIVNVLQTAMALSALSLHGLQGQYFKLVTLGPAISAARAASRKVIDAGQTSVQIPALIRAETAQAIKGMTSALEVLRIQDDTHRQGNRELLARLSTEALELSGQLAQLAVSHA